MNEFSDPRAMTPADSPMTLDDVRASADLRDLGTPKLREGDPAADFTLPRLATAEPAGDPADQAMTLSDHFGIRPVALVFGSYT
jgi:hypothetical protein